MFSGILLGPPTLVDVNMNIRSMGPISEIDMVSWIDIYYSHWS